MEPTKYTKMGSQSDLQEYYELLNAMQRVYNIGLYYPIGHAVADRAIDSFLNTVQKNVDKRGHLLLGVTKRTLLVRKEELDPAVPAVKTFYEMFSSLHITSLDIHRDINAEEARQFFGEVIAHYSKARCCRDFSQVIVKGLPKTVKIRQLKLAVDDEEILAEELEDTGQPTIEYLLSSLMQRGIEEEMIFICRELLLSARQALEKRQLNSFGLASVSWEDVEKLLFGLAEFLQSTAQSDSTRPLEERYNLDALLAILTALDDPDGDAQSKQAVKSAVNLLIDITKGPTPEVQETFSQGEKSLRPRDRTDTSVAELKKELLILEKHCTEAPLFQPSRAEELSVLMLTLGQPLSPQILLNIQRGLRNCFAHVLDAEEWNIVLQGTQSLFKQLKKERLCFVLTLFFQVLRSSPHISPLIFVRDICRELTSDELVLFWPFLMNELLLEGVEKEPMVFQKLCTIAGSLAKEDMWAALPSLKKLEAMSERKVAVSIFLYHPIELRFLFKILLESSQAAYFCKRLIDGLRGRPFGWLDKAVLPLLDGSSKVDQHFIVNLLYQENPVYPGKTLREEGAIIIVERLKKLSLEQRKEPWVAESITALSKVPLLSAYSLLVEIAQDKQFLLVAKWPRPARLAALKALESY